jgi:hypothetical protein
MKAGRWSDTTNFRRDTHNLDSGERLHVVERLTRVDTNTLRYRVTVEIRHLRNATAEWPFRAQTSRCSASSATRATTRSRTFSGARADQRRHGPRR